MPDILPVGLQDVLYSGKPELREGKIIDFMPSKEIGNVSSDYDRCLLCVYKQNQKSCQTYVTLACKYV